ncbi:MAG: N-acetyl-gamma-glutamyl-phosphate reductase [Candidatus Heteroscillospira sp.]|jgi:N-acetyl-gamma-glutamyl-phosphate reductase
MSNKTRIFIDGKEGTTGLRIYDRIGRRDDLELILLPEETRKNPDARRKAINESDITFLCLPDAASREAVAMIENPNVKIIDTSTAHRVSPGWVYGFPELNREQAAAIAASHRVANPGCYATGFISLVRPLVDCGFLSADSHVTAHALSGYSGAGKKTIAVYESDDKPEEFNSPRLYALGLAHKHLPEMKAMTGLERTPIFTPIICDYYCGMTVTVPLFADQLRGGSVKALRDAYSDFYAGQRFIRVTGENEPESGFLGSNNMAGRDSLEIFVSGNGEQILCTARFDNLGKGASGAAIECMNIMLGQDPAMGLDL